MPCEDPIQIPLARLSHTLAVSHAQKSGAIDVKDNPASISDDGRFVTFMAGFESATLRGTLEPPPAPVSRRNLFLYDGALGITWAVTREARMVRTPLNDRFEAPIDIEAMCCPSASSSTQRGTCSLRNEYRQACCWQRPCFNPGPCARRRLSLLPFDFHRPVRSHLAGLVSAQS